MEEQESLVTILLDASASMEAKWASARAAAEAVGYLALTGGDRLCLQILKDGRTLRSPQFAGRAAYPRLTGFLDTCVPDGKTGTITEAVKHAEGLKKGLCFLITDGYTEDGLKEALDYLRYMKQETAVIQTLSGGELKPDLEGAVRLTDSESGEQTDLLADRGALDAYQDALEAFLKQIRETCASREAPYMLLDSRQSFEESFIPLLSKSGMI